MVVYCFVAIAMSELLFECYSAPSIAYGVDALFSYQYNSLTNNGMHLYSYIVYTVITS